jgi:NH3-dependent NAD+ synthetase
LAKPAMAQLSTDNIIADLVQNLKDQIGDNNVLLGLSGGVDSSVVAALLNKVCVLPQGHSHLTRHRSIFSEHWHE